MQWTEIAVVTNHAGADFVAELLVGELGAKGVVVDDAALLNRYIDANIWDYTSLTKNSDEDTVTVTVEIPAEVKERETRDSTSVLETSIAKSTAKLTWQNGELWLFHSLENKPQKIEQKAEVETKEKIKTEYKTRYVTKTKYVNVEKPFPWWSKILMWAGGIAIAILVIGTLLHIIGKDINRLL